MRKSEVKIFKHEFANKTGYKLVYQSKKDRHLARYEIQGFGGDFHSYGTITQILNLLYESGYDRRSHEVSSVLRDLM